MYICLRAPTRERRKDYWWLQTDVYLHLDHRVFMVMPLRFTQGSLWWYVSCEKKGSHGLFYIHFFGEYMAYRRPFWTGNAQSLHFWCAIRLQNEMQEWCCCPLLVRFLISNPVTILFCFAVQHYPDWLWTLFAKVTSQVLYQSVSLLQATITQQLLKCRL